jgi:hypothetical protein
MSIVAMPSPARQFEDAKALRCDGFRHLALEPRRARHGAVPVGDVDLQHQRAAPGDRLNPTDDIGYRELAVRVGGRADIDGEISNRGKCR